MTNIQQAKSDPNHLVGSIIAGRYRILQILGTGSFAIVYLAVDIVSSKQVAVKCLSKYSSTLAAQGDSADKERLAAQLREIAIMKKLQPHPYIVALYDCIEVDQFIFLVMEYCEMDLYEAITQKGGFPEDVVREVFLQLVDALIHSHENGVYHRDIKPENCLISSEYTLKLTDFGLSTTDKWSHEFGCGSVRYMAPECLAVDSDTGKGYSPALNDVWSLGIILINLLFGKNPWHEASLSDPLYSMYISKNPDILKEQFGLTSEFNSILKAVFQRDPSRRATLHQLRGYVQHVPCFTAKYSFNPRKTAAVVPSSAINQPTVAVKRPQMLNNSILPQTTSLASTTLSTMSSEYSIQSTVQHVQPTKNLVAAVSSLTSLHTSSSLWPLESINNTFEDNELFVREDNGVNQQDNLSTTTSDMFYIFKYDYAQQQLSYSNNGDTQHHHFSTPNPQDAVLPSSSNVVAMDISQVSPQVILDVSRSGSCFSDLASESDERYMQQCNKMVSSTPITPKDQLHQFPSFCDSAVALSVGNCGSSNHEHFTEMNPFAEPGKLQQQNNNTEKTNITDANGGGNKKGGYFSMLIPAWAGKSPCHRH